MDFTPFLDPQTGKMSNQEKSDFLVSSSSYYRIVALWALSESFIGGVLHGLHLPVTGLVLGSFSVLCLKVLSDQTPHKQDLMKATVLVMLVKFSLSPQSPPAAYLAVSFQGFLAYLIFSFSGNKALQCYALGILVLLESALQRILVLWILFGNDLVSAFDGFVNGLMTQFYQAPHSHFFGLVGIYLFVHLVFGGIAGHLALKIPDWVRNQKKRGLNLKIKTSDIWPVNTKSKVNFRLPMAYVVGIILIGIAIFQHFHPEAIPEFNQSKIIKLILRFATLISIWLLIISPIIKFILERWLTRQKSRFSNELGEVLELIPALQKIVIQSWHYSMAFSFWKRVPTFLSTLFYLSIQSENE